MAFQVKNGNMMAIENTKCHKLKHWFTKT